MNRRLLFLIDYYTNGNKAEFCRQLGWKPQYLQKLLKNEAFGIAPVLSVLGKYKEVNARWFLFGVGNMLDI